MSFYSIKMRASKGLKHVSGAERIVKQEEISENISALTERALHHGLGQADFINLKLQQVKEEELQHLEALPVTSQFADSVEESFAILVAKLKKLGLDDFVGLAKLLQEVKPMRGAVLYDIATNSRLEPDQDRGVRVTYMDAAEDGSIGVKEGANSCNKASGKKPCSGKNHFREALVLATKVVNCPGILAELCISDDPEYVTGYIASKEFGYVRLSPLKQLGDRHGGRIFICDTRVADKETIINYLEQVKVLVHNVPEGPEAKACAKVKACAGVNACAEVKTALQSQISTEKADNSSNPLDSYASALEYLKSKALYRTMKRMDSEQSRYVEYKGKQVLMMASNSYLDLAADPRVKEAAAVAALQWGAGSGGSRLTTGNCGLHEELEAKLAKLKDKEAALLFNTGYMANLGIISGLMDKNSVVYSDELNHASIIDGARLSKADIVVYKHNDIEDLEAKLKANAGKKGLIVSDAVFSMDGDLLNLPEYVALGKKYGVLTMIDEAHATGVVGKTGKGLVEHYGCEAPDIIMGTLSKSLGSEGGFACASQLLIDYLRNKARSFIFSTSQSPATLGAALKALEVLEQEPERATNLQKNVVYFCERLKYYGVKAASPTAIVPILVGEEERALAVADYLLQHGVLVPAIRYPTVAKGTARLRVALMATHTEDELDRTALLIAEAFQQC